jgi:hypothetical protein
MEANVDKCLALCQTLVEASHQFTFTLTIGKDTLSFSTYDQPCKGSACKDRDLKKAAPLQQRRRDRRAADPAVQQKAATYAAAAGQAAVGAPAQSLAPLPEMGGAAGPARPTAEEARREPSCRRCKQPVAGHPGAEQAAAVPSFLPSPSSLPLPSALVPSASLLPPSPGPGAAVEPLATTGLSSLTNPKLRSLCKERQLPSTGSKAVLLERLGTPEVLRGSSTKDTTAKVSPGKDSREEEPSTPGNRPGKLCCVCRNPKCTPTNSIMGRCEHYWANPELQY